MEEFLFEFPAKVYYGADSLMNLRILANKRVLFVYGKSSLKESGNYDVIMNILSENNVKVFELGGNDKPSYSKVLEGIKLVKTNKIEAVLGVGGSTVMDMSKIISFGSKNDNLWDFLSHKLDPTGRASLFTVLIPTYPAGGSETDSASEIDNLETGEHGSLYGIYPNVAILNPKLTYFLDLKETSYSAIEQFVQASCSILGTKGIVRELGNTVVKNILKSLNSLRCNLQDELARTNLLLSSSINVSGLISSGGSQIGMLIYSLEGIGESLLGMSYRDALIVYFPLFLNGLYKYYPEEILLYAKEIFGKETLSECLEEIYTLYDKFNLPMSYNEFGTIPSDNVILDNIEEVEPFTLKDQLDIFKAGFINK